MSDYKDAAPLLSSLPNAKEFLAEQGYGAKVVRIALLEKGIMPCTASKKTVKSTRPGNLRTEA